MRIPSAGERCHAFLLDQYFKRLPQGALERDVFYLRPLTKVERDEESVWFSAVAVGRNNWR